jgi:protein-disulfide isomerase
MRFKRPLLACAFLSLIGLGLASYLFYIHLGLLRGELLGGPVCTGGHGLLNCHAVTAGTWGSFLGMPLALWGVLGYVLVLTLTAWGESSEEQARRSLTLITVLSALFLLVDAGLLFLMAQVIRFYCAFCMLTYLVNASLLLVAAMSLRQSLPTTLSQAGAAVVSLIPSAINREAGLWWVAMLVGVLGVSGVHASTTYAIRGSLKGMQTQLREFMVKQPRVSVDVATDPVKGPPAGSLQLVEFSDFFCPACQRAAKLNTILLASYPKDAALVFKNYPLDSSCNSAIPRMVHPGACQVAAAGECAHLQGKFWAFHDRVFEQGHDYDVRNLSIDAERAGLQMEQFTQCLQTGQGMEAVRRDIADGQKVGVTSTPTYVINGIPWPGGPSPAIFKDFVKVLREQR